MIKKYVQNQLRRRNVIPEQKQYFINRMYENEKKEQHRPGNNGVKSKPLRTSESIAERVNVSSSTVKNAHKYGKLVDKLDKSGLNKNEKFIV